jgi:hypothetical protein
MFLLCLGVCEATLGDGRTDILFAPYGRHTPSPDKIQVEFSPTY